jgi:2-iminobutanoate/2-iminopropanoate deaminase
MIIRRSINVDGFHHGGQPIPAACRVGNFVTTGGIHGMDPKTQTLPDDAEAQIAHMFANLERILEAAGAGMASVAKMTVFVKDKSLRDLVNTAWIKSFPDESSRPARHTVVNENLPGNMVVQCDAMAIADGVMS